MLVYLAGALVVHDGQAEVGDHAGAVGPHQDVLRLDVTVRYGRFALVGRKSRIKCNCNLITWYYLRSKMVISFLKFAIFWESLFTFMLLKLHFDRSSTFLEKRTSQNN